MVPIPAGTFVMGSTNGETDETPLHSVAISGFQMGQTVVTKAQWEAVMNTTPWMGQAFIDTDPDSPAVYISWTDARNFIAILSNLTGEDLPATDGGGMGVRPAGRVAPRSTTLATARTA